MDREVSVTRGSGVSNHVEIIFRCECDDAVCRESVVMSTEEYGRTHSEKNHFVVIPTHVHLEIEEIISSVSNYVLVAKAQHLRETP